MPQIARVRLDAAVAPETPQFNVDDEAWWKKMELGQIRAVLEPLEPAGSPRYDGSNQLR